jgi:methionyl-tRNA formyltransferase
LPLYRGSAPIQWAIADGRKETGVTVQELSKDRFDRGKTLAQKMVPLSSDATYLAMEPILARVGGQLLLDLMLDFESGKVCTLPTF